MILRYHQKINDCTMPLDYVNMEGETANSWSEKTQFICEEPLVRGAIMTKCNTKQEIKTATYNCFLFSVPAFAMIAPSQEPTLKVKLQKKNGQKRHSFCWCVMRPLSTDQKRHSQLSMLHAAVCVLMPVKPLATDILDDCASFSLLTFLFLSMWFILSTFQ